MIPLSECEKGKIYALKSRNLTLGVFDGDRGFIGIREKFAHKYLFKEYHHDTGPPFGTVTPLKFLEVSVPNWIPLKETLADVCRNCGRPVLWNDSLNKDINWEHIPWERYSLEEEKVTSFVHDCEKPRAISISNSYLFKFLEEVEKNLSQE